MMTPDEVAQKFDEAVKGETQPIRTRVLGAFWMPCGLREVEGRESLERAQTAEAATDIEPIIQALESEGCIRALTATDYGGAFEKELKTRTLWVMTPKGAAELFPTVDETTAPPQCDPSSLLSNEDMASIRAETIRRHPMFWLRIMREIEATIQAVQQRLQADTVDRNTLLAALALMANGKLVVNKRALSDARDG